MVLNKIIKEIEQEIIDFETIINSENQSEDDYAFSIHIGGLKKAITIIKKYKMKNLKNKCMVN